MILSHKYQCIFIKTGKTAGTSIEAYMGQFCGADDVVTPFVGESYPNHEPKNYEGFFNPIPEMIFAFPRGIKTGIQDFLKKQKFRNHLQGPIIQNRIPKKIWDSYYKFCVERNPYDKVVSHYYFIISRKNLNLSFDEFLDSSYNCINFPSYTDYPKFRKIIVDKVIMYENLSEELQEVFDQLGIPFEGSLNVKAKSHYRPNRDNLRHQMTEEQKTKIENKHYREFELFGYQF